MHLNTQRAIFVGLTALICLFFTVTITKPANAGIATIYQCRTPNGNAATDLMSSTGNEAITVSFGYCSS